MLLAKYFQVRYRCTWSSQCMPLNKLLQKCNSVWILSKKTLRIGKIRNQEEKQEARVQNAYLYQPSRPPDLSTANSPMWMTRRRAIVSKIVTATTATITRKAWLAVPSSYLPTPSSLCIPVPSLSLEKHAIFALWVVNVAFNNKKRTCKSNDTN